MKMKQIVPFFVLLLLFQNNFFSQEINHSHSIHHAFIENKGQWDKNVLFKSKFQGGNLWIQQNKFVFHLQDFSAVHNAHANFKDSLLDTELKQTVVHLNFVGSNKINTITKVNQTEQYFNYFIGNKKEKWASDVHGYSEANLVELYDGIDMKLIEHLEELKYEFHVKPKTDPKIIQLEYVGQKQLQIDAKGALIISTDLGNIIEQKPYSYQIINGKIIEIPCAFVLNDNQVSFRLGKYNPEVELVIDPVLIFATYSGSITDNFGMTATYGHDGKAYSGGTIFGNGYPTPDNLAFDVTSNFTVVTGPNYGITDVFISKYSADGTSMLWTSFMGGGDEAQGTEIVNSMITDLSDNIYFFGATSSVDFPIQGGYQPTHAGGVAGLSFLQNGVYYTDQGTDIYVAKLSANGHALMGSTYIGGSGNDGVNYKISSGIYSSASSYDSLTYNYGDSSRGEIMLDENGNCVIASSSRSTDFPVLNAFQPANAGMQDGVVFKLSNDLSALGWSSYFGGSNNDGCYSVKIDSSFNIVFAGGTSSNNLPQTAGKFLPIYSGGIADGFVGKIAPSGLTLSGVSYIGTSDYDQVYIVEIDRNDNVFVVGQSKGGLFPVINSGYVDANSSQFICKLNPSLTTALNSTVFGNGSPLVNISPAAFLVDVCGNIYVSGWGGNILTGVPLTGMPTTPDAFQASSDDGFNFYLFVLDRTFNFKIYASYIGDPLSAEHVDGGTSRFDRNGVVYQSVCGGCGGHSTFPTYPNPGAWSNSNLSSNCNNIVFKFDFAIIPKAEFVVGDNLGCTDFEVIFENTSSASDSYLWDFGNGDTSTIIFNPIITYTDPGIYDVFLYVTDSICNLTDTAKIVITVAELTQLTVSPDVEQCYPSTQILTANSFGTASSFVWSSSINFSDTLNTNVLDSTLTVNSEVNTTYYVMINNLGNCPKIDSVQIHFTSSDLDLTGVESICSGDIVEISAINTNPALTFTYAWSPTSIIVTPSTTNQVFVAPPVSQYVYLTATASNGCILVDSLFIAVSIVNPAEVIASVSDNLVPEGTTVVLTAQPDGLSYSWTPSAGVESPTSQTTNALVNVTTLFTLFVTDGICTKMDTIWVKIFPFICNEPSLFIPNAFSPNGDGQNDVLYVRGKMIKDMTFRVFNRWGELMFESFERSVGWDGTYKGKKMEPDVYDYYLKVTCIDNVESIVKGNVTLLK